MRRRWWRGARSGAAHLEDDGPPRSAHRVAVVLAPPLQGWSSVLDGALDERFVVSVGPPPPLGVGVVQVDDPEELTRLRASARHTGLIVLLDGRTESGRTADLFDAGADVVLTSPDVRMLAAHVRALARRYDG